VIGKTGNANENASQLKCVNLYDPEKLMNLGKNRDSVGFRYTVGSKLHIIRDSNITSGEGTRFASESPVLVRLPILAGERFMKNKLVEKQW
jgi:hypothetical protein